MKKFLLLMLLAPAALSAAADSGADASVVVRKDSAFVEKHRFLPTAKRIDRRIDRNKFAYKGEVALGITASYGTISSDDTDMMLILDNINLDGTMAQVNPFVGYFYRDNNCLGVRFGYRHMGGSLDNAVIMHDGAIISKDGMRHKEEFARHKMMDLVGDIFLTGMRVRAKVTAIRAGHPTHVKLAGEMLAQYAANHQNT